MKRGLFLGIWSLFLTILITTLIIALPNPSASYCTEMGYAYNLGNETCIFDNETNCPAWDFYRGTCGQEYAKNISCANEGESKGIVKVCCEGLDTISNYNIEKGKCSIPLPGGYGTCSNCGNENCEDWENKCNCPEDCESNNGSNETNHENEENKTDEDRNETENDNKICCMITKAEDDNKTEIEYSFKEFKDCLKNETDKKREIVNNSLCEIKEKHEFKERNRLKFENRVGIECPEECICTGVVMKCQLASGREMTIFAGNSGNIIVQVKGINMTTNVTLYKENDTLYGNFSNKTKEIKILPDEARERLREKLKSEIEEERDIELEDDGNYKMEVKKKAKLFWVFSVKEKVKAEVNSENGETKTSPPWWGFLARDSKIKE